jgi:large subunit ribosomal protein L41
MSLNLLRKSNVLNNIFCETMRKRMGLSFRKTLGVYNYKVKPAEYYKNPHQVELRLKERLKNRKNELSTRNLNAVRRNSIRPFGRFTTKSKFIVDHQRVPNFNIPDLTEFPLKPYAARSTPKLNAENVFVYSNMTRDLMGKIQIQMKNSEDEDVKQLANEIFETDEGKKIVEEYFKKIYKRSKLKIVNF